MTHESANCPNCDKTFSPDDFRPLAEMEDLATKLQYRVGDEVPAGECKVCGSLVYSVGVDRVGKAMSVLTRDYYDDVRGMVEMVKDEIKDGTFSTRDEVLEYVHESCDGAQRVIYTQQAKICLLVSDNEDAYFDEFGGESPNDVSVLAFCAFYRDVMDRLEIPECDCGELATVEGPCGEQLCKSCAEEILEDEEEESNDE